MGDMDPKRLIGTYSTPAVRVGDRVVCQMRGEVELVCLTDTPIPWPVGKRDKHKAIVLYADLVKAAKLEASGAICSWWGVREEKVPGKIRGGQPCPAAGRPGTAADRGPR